jgi:hypothetical protein
MLEANSTTEAIYSLVFDMLEDKSSSPGRQFYNMSLQITGK